VHGDLFFESCYLWSFFFIGFVFVTIFFLKSRQVCLDFYRVLFSQHTHTHTHKMCKRQKKNTKRGEREMFFL